jgi:glutamyl endopeptidase
MLDLGGWASRIDIIPGRNGADSPYGTASVETSGLRSTTGWTRDQNSDYDYAALLLPADAALGNTVGWFGYDALGDDALRGQDINISGYPGDKDNGATQWWMANRITAVNAQTFDYQIDTFGGQSGAPVFMVFEDRGRIGVGVHTHGSQAGNSATRFTSEVLSNLNAWRAEVP